MYGEGFEGADGEGGERSYKRDDGTDILDAFYTSGNDGPGNLDTEHGLISKQS